MSKISRASIAKLIIQLNLLDPKPSLQTFSVLGHFYMSPKHMHDWLGVQALSIIDEITLKAGNSSGPEFLRYLEEKLKVDLHRNRESDASRASHEIMLRLLEGRVGELENDIITCETNIKETTEIQEGIELSLPEEDRGKSFSDLDLLNESLRLLTTQKTYLTKQYDMICTSLIVSESLIELASFFGREDAKQQLLEIKRKLQPERFVVNKSPNLIKKKFQKAASSPRIPLSASSQASPAFFQRKSARDVWRTLSLSQQQAVLDFAEERGQYLFVHSMHLVQFFNEQDIPYICQLSRFSDEQALQSADAIIRGHGRLDGLTSCGLIIVKHENIELEMLLEIGLIQFDDLAAITHVPERRDTKSVTVLSNQISKIFDIEYEQIEFEEDVATLINNIVKGTEFKEKIDLWNPIVIPTLIDNINLLELSDTKKSAIRNKLIEAYQWETIMKDAGVFCGEDGKLLPVKP